MSEGCKLCRHTFLAKICMSKLLLQRVICSKLTFFPHEQHFSFFFLFFLNGLHFFKSTSQWWSHKVNLTLDLWLNMLKFIAYLNFFLSIVPPCYAAFLYCKPLLFDPCFPKAVSLITILTSPVICCLWKGLSLFLKIEIMNSILLSLATRSCWVEFVEFFFCLFVFPKNKSSRFTFMTDYVLIIFLLSYYHLFEMFLIFSFLLTLCPIKTSTEQCLAWLCNFQISLSYNRVTICTLQKSAVMRMMNKLSVNHDKSNNYVDI